MSVSKDVKTKTWTVQLWYKDFTGKRRHTTKRGFATKREAEKYEREFLCAEHPEELTLGELYNKYCDYVKLRLETGSIRSTTVLNKRHLAEEYFLPYFKDSVCSKITTNDINIWEHELITNYETSRGDRLSSGTIKNAKGELSQIFNYGVKNFGLLKNPVKLAENISHYSNDNRTLWTREQFQQFHNALNDTPAMQLVCDIIYAAGLRVGEVLAITPNDITPYSIAVVKTVARLPGIGTEIHSAKTEASIRNVQIPKFLYEEIMAYIKTLKSIKETDKIFPFTDSLCRQRLYATEKKLGLPHSSLHMLRHLYASTLYAETHDLSVVASQLGHASVNVTAEVYIDMIKGNDRKAIDNLEETLKIEDKK